MNTSSKEIETKQFLNILGQFQSIDSDTDKSLNQMVDRKTPEVSARILITLVRSTKEPDSYVSQLIKTIAEHPELASIDPGRLPTVIQSHAGVADYDNLTLIAKKAPPLRMSAVIAIRKRNCQNLQDSSSEC